MIILPISILLLSIVFYCILSHPVEFVNSKIAYQCKFQFCFFSSGKVID